MGGSLGDGFAMSVQGSSGRFLISGWPKQKAGTFTLAPDKQQRFLIELERFRVEAGNAEPKHIPGARVCDDGSPYIYDAGWIEVQWIGIEKEEHFTANFGCPSPRRAERDKAISDFVMSYYNALNAK